MFRATCGWLGYKGLLALDPSRPFQLCVDIGNHIISETKLPSTQAMGAVFAELEQLAVITSAICNQLKGAVGFSNIAVHNYEALNWGIVYAICEKTIGDFRRFTRKFVSILVAKRTNLRKARKEQ